VVSYRVVLCRATKFKTQTFTKIDAVGGIGAGVDASTAAGVVVTTSATIASAMRIPHSGARTN